MTDLPGLPELTDLVRDCSVAGVSRRVLLVRMDLLPPRLARPHHLRIADEALEPLLGADRARRHTLPHGRVAISWRGADSRRLHTTLDGLAHLLLDAPLEAPTIPEFARIFDLPEDGAALLAIADSPGPAAPHPAGSPPTPSDEPPPLPPLDLADIGAMEASLATANVARFARRRAICRLGPRTLSTAWEHRFLDIPGLIEELAPGRSPTPGPWLLHRLTRVLDRRILALLTAPAELRGAGPFGLDLNVGGILSPEFLRFDSALPPRLRDQTILGLHPADIMADLPSFRFACAFARTRGHRILLRGITPALLPLLNLRALDPDFVELAWSPACAAIDPASVHTGTARWVLAGADDPTAIAWGRGVGIGLFQGHAAQPGSTGIPPHDPAAGRAAIQPAA